MSTYDAKKYKKFWILVILFDLGLLRIDQGVTSFKNNSLENVNFQWNIKWKEKMIYFCHLSVFHWTLTFLKELLINFILVYFLVSSYVALFYISKGVRKNVSIISERSSKRCKENRSITLCQKEQSESTVINANFSKSAPSSKKNNNRKPFKKYMSCFQWNIKEKRYTFIFCHPSVN